MRRHPAMVTLDRLIDASFKYDGLLEGSEKDAIGIVCRALHEIAEYGCRCPECREASRLYMTSNRAQKRAS